MYVSPQDGSICMIGVLPFHQATVFTKLYTNPRVRKVLLKSTNIYVHKLIDRGLGYVPL